jgi:hypothetical protein
VVKFDGFSICGPFSKELPRAGATESACPDPVHAG